MILDGKKNSRIHQALACANICKAGIAVVAAQVTIQAAKVHWMTWRWNEAQALILDTQKRIEKWYYRLNLVGYLWIFTYVAIDTILDGKKTRQFVTVGNYETLQISWDQ